MIQLALCSEYREGEALLRVKGHAHFAPKGSDVVCAAVSVLVTTYINALEYVGKAKITVVDEDELTVYLDKISDVETLKTVSETVAIGVMQLAHEYPKYVEFEII